MKLTVAKSFPAPKLWEAEQKPVTLPKNDIIYQITKKGREHVAAQIRNDDDSSHASP